MEYVYKRKELMVMNKKKTAGEYGRGKKIQLIEERPSIIDEKDFKGLVGEITHILTICDIFSIENIKFYFPKWFFGTSKSKGIDLIGCFVFDSKENGFIGESKFISSASRVVNVAESAIEQAEKNVDGQTEDNINKFNNILRLLVQAKLFLQPMDLFQSSEPPSPFLNPILYLNKVTFSEIERKIEKLFGNKEDVKLLIHVISPAISTMKSEDLSFKDISISCQSLVTCMDCRNEMVDTGLLEGKS